MGEVEKNNFIALPGKGGHSGPMPLKTVCPNLGVFDEKIFGFFFFFFWLRWVFVAARGLSLVAASRGYSSLRCMGFSLRWLLLLWSMGSRHVGFSSCGTRALESRLSNCGALV